MRGRRNDDYWSAFMSGNQVGEPRVPEQYNGFIDRLKAAGIHPVRKGRKTQVMTMTDKDVDDLAGDRIVRVADTVNMHKNLEPVKGGLFDKTLFGDGDKFAAIQLPEPMPNPVFEEPIRRMLGLTEKQFRTILGGREELPGYGTGPEAFTKRLKSMNLDKEIADARRDIAGTKKTARDAAVRRLGYLKGLKRTNTEPGDLMINKVPVLPTRFRPIAQLQGKGGVMINDANFLYKELMHAGEGLAGLQGKTGDLHDERLAMYDAHRALVGLTDPDNQELKQRKVKGLLKTILGKNSPKSSLMQRKMLSGTVDTIGRGVIMVDSKLDMDTIGVPENMAFGIYEPYIIRNLVQRGIPRVQAMEMVKNQDSHARQELVREMDRRPVTFSRAPVLHKYGDMGFKPILVKGETIRLNAVATQPLGADNDGNCLGFSEMINLKISTKHVLGDSAEPLINEETVMRFLVEECGMKLTKNQILAMESDGEIDAVVRIGKVADLRQKLVLEKPNQKMYALPAGIRILSYDHASSYPVWADASTVTVEENHRVVKVTSRRKRTVECSDNESLAVFDPETGDLVKRRPEDSIGMLMPAVIQEPGTAVDGSFDHGWIHAALVANGWTTRSNIFGYAHNDQIARDTLVRLVRERWDADLTYKTYHDDGSSEGKFSKSSKIHVTSAAARSLIPEMIHQDIVNYGTDESWVTARTGKHPWQDNPRKALFKKLSIQDCDHYGRISWLGVLCGYLENDGTLLVKTKPSGHPQIVCVLNTSSPYLLEDFKKVLRMLGIRYCIARKQATNQSHPGFSLVLSGTDIRRLVAAGELKFYTNAANAWLAQVVELVDGGQSNDSIDIVPATATDFTELRELARQVNKTVYTAVCKAMKVNYIGRYTANRLVNEIIIPQGLTDRFDAFVQRTAAPNIHWDIVDKVEEVGIETVYDIGVDSTKVFALNNGLVV